MDNPSTPTSEPTSSAKPFPTSDAKPSTAAQPEATPAAVAAAVPIVDRLIQRATSSAHGAVDKVAARVSAVSGGLQDGVSRVGDTRDEWIESARDAIRQHPFAAIAGALVIGAALSSLNGARRH